MPEILLVRHGRTELNDPSNEKIRGYSDVPISYEGKRGTLEAAEFIAKQKFPIQRILSTPLQRGIMTASLIAEKINAKVIPNQGLLPWNLGHLTGKPVSEAAKVMDYLQEFFDIKAPEGESYRSFYTRWAETIDLMLFYAEQHPDETLVAVVHSRNLLALPSILGDRQIGDVPVKGGPGPESITRISHDDNGNWKFETIWDKGNN
jgi:broad specificity phosphatase PhoE